MNIRQFLHTTNLDHSLLVGYYGGGNYGDELLLEVLSNLLAQKGTTGVRVTYQHPEQYPSMHRDFGFELVDMHNRWALLKTALKSRRIIVGGGGLWGVDMNFNTLLLSIFLFVGRWVLGKKVYLLGVGYYSSTTALGRIGAWFAAKAANVILARDDESTRNFGMISKNVHQDKDLAWQTQNLDLTPYRQEVAALQKRLPVGHNTLLMALRRPQAKRQHGHFAHYNNLVRQFIQTNPNRPIILAMPESEAKGPELYAEAKKWRRQHKHLRILEAPYNPLTFLAYIRQNQDRLALVAPQLHLIITAHLAGVPFLPLVYDNKVAELFDQIGIPANQRIAIANITIKDLETFASKCFGGTEA